VTDAEILEAYRLLAHEGVFCEPASAASVAGLLKVAEQVPAETRVVCVLTGNGLKDPDTAITHSQNQVKAGLNPDVVTLAKAMGF
ncbi:MAG TPA: pyridoxal-phosphate dependent enzyme, partial [Leptolyngbyaceae cyanobacterium M65_K2018_010]|nr:pyridoxal-phosphate dependent enzyme [Leptolyngbyaceae cyanobacterium M65_K2018_010]